ncbi:hypothetical protein [Pseudomonas japonica]|uniref:DUF3077 domain-containing protein n=1 Tax=Pseudomonas japonica TaxID=256466 RepID=A0A239JJQ1_9PSED|nr:hypothetical protein [Pseudomonas japonica]SNT06055.1 hypothetical protein SAMN05444352_12292 [Pseudomonas japonica]
MKKHVPDPPPVMTIREGLCPEEAIRLAGQHLEKAIDHANEATEDLPTKQRWLIQDSILQMQITRALLKASATGTSVVI